MSSMINEDAWPGAIEDVKIRQLLERYYTLSNTPNVGGDITASEQDFADLFETEKGVYQLASKRAQGRDAIVAMRRALFAGIPKREHRVTKIYTFGTDQTQLMVLGSVEYGHHHGHGTEGDWAAKVVLTRVGELVKFAEVQIIIDTAAHI